MKWRHTKRAIKRKDQWNRVVLWKDKQTWQNLSQTNQKKEGEDPISKVSGKRGKLQQISLKSRDSLGIFWKLTFQ
jgi:hypothetical protein